MANYFTEAGCKLITTDIPNKKTKVTYICVCGETITKTVSEFIRKGCRYCNEKAIKSVPDKPEYKDDETGEIWKPIVGGWISSFGNAKNVFDKPLSLCNTKYRYHIGGKNQYASRIVACVFKIKNYEKLDSQSYAVSHIDGNPKNNRVENLVVISKNEIGAKNGLKSHKSDLFADKIKWKIDKFANLEYKIIKELPNHIIYSNGEIWNGKHFLTFSNVENYYNFITSDISYKVHRLVCYAFHPLPDKNCLDDYDNLQVNHKDGNKGNNSADNLEWVTSSENQTHSYKSLRKGQSVIQISKESGEKIDEFSSIALASRNSGDTEHAIRSCAKGKPNRYAKYNWKFVDEKLADIYKTKYSMMK